MAMTDSTNNRETWWTSLSNIVNTAYSWVRDTYISLAYSDICDAARNGSVLGVQHFLENGVSVDETKDVYRNTALHRAVKRGHIDVVRLLVERGANIEAKESDKSTPLYLAAMLGHTDIARYLLDCGANIESQGYYKRTPLSVATFYKNIDVFRLLIERGANIEARDSDEETILHVACSSMPINVDESNEIRFEIVCHLLERGANLSARNREGCTPLHEATMFFACSAIVRLLIEHGANLEEQNNAGQTAIVGAFECGRHDIVALLEHYGAILPAYLIAGDEINDNQSAHTVSVHFGVSISVRELSDYYKLSSQAIARAHSDLKKFVDRLVYNPSAPVSDKIGAAKRGLPRLQSIRFTDARSKISLYEAMALVWVGLNDPKEIARKRKERGFSKAEQAMSHLARETLLHCEEEATLKEVVVDWLYQAQRNYNISKTGIDNQGADVPSCTSGSFNISVYALNGRHPLVNIPLVNKKLINAKVPILANQFFDKLTEKERYQYARDSENELPSALVERLKTFIAPELHKEYDDHQSDGLDVNQIIEEAMGTLEYVNIRGLKRIRKTLEPSAAASSSTPRPQ